MINIITTFVGIVRVVFLIGKPNNEIIQNIINKEAYQFKDILQGDFVDTYFNLTHKVSWDING
jgi:hypothetical protein